MFDTAGLKKTFPDLAVQRRAIVGFDNVRISIGAEYFVHDLNNLFSSSRAYNFYNRKARILICNDCNQVLTRRKRTTEVYAKVDPWTTWKVRHVERFCVLSGSVSLTWYAASYGIINGSVDAWEPNFAPNQCFGLTCALMTFVGQLYGSGL